MCKKMGTRWNIVGPDHNGSASGAPSWTRVIEGSTGHRVRGWGVDKKRVNRNGRTAKWFLTSFGKFWRRVMDLLGTCYFSLMHLIVIQIKLETRLFCVALTTWVNLKVLLQSYTREYCFWMHTRRHMFCIARFECVWTALLCSFLVQMWLENGEKFCESLLNYYMHCFGLSTR